MKLTNPPIIRGLGKTGSPNRRGLLLRQPTTQGLAQTATRLAREPEHTGEPLKVTQLVSATDDFFFIDAAETEAVSLTINRLAGSSLDINISVGVGGVAGDDGAGPPFTVFFQVYRDADLFDTASFFLPVVNVTLTAADQIYQGAWFAGFVDSDYVTGVHEYSFTVLIQDSAAANVGGGAQNGADAYIRVLERRL